MATLQAVTAAPGVALADARFIDLVTFRRSGVPVGTPVLFAQDGARLLVRTAAGDRQAQAARPHAGRGAHAERREGQPPRCDRHRARRGSWVRRRSSPPSGRSMPSTAIAGPGGDVRPPRSRASRRDRRDHPGRGPVTRLAARLVALFRAAPGRPSLVETASLAMFSIVGAPPLTWPSPTAWTEPGADAADRDRRGAAPSTATSPRVRHAAAGGGLTFEAAPVRSRLDAVPVNVHPQGKDLLPRFRIIYRVG